MKTINRNRQRPEGQRAHRNEEQAIRNEVKSGMRPDKFPDSSMSKDQREDQQKVAAAHEESKRNK